MPAVPPASRPNGAAGCPRATLVAPGLAMPADAGLTYRREPVCGVVVVAAAAGVPFATAWAMLGELHDADIEGYKYPRGRTRKSHGIRPEVWRGQTTFVDRCCVLYALGVRWRHEVMNVPTKLFVWDRDFAKPGETYILSVGGSQRTRHVMLIRDGLALDQGGILPVDLHWSRHALVEDIQLIREPRK